MPDAKLGLDQLNASGQAEIARLLAGLYEHSPWVAEKAAANAPFATARALLDALQGAVLAADPAQQIELICRHPELAGREAAAGTMTAASTSEQGRLGLDRLTRAEFEELAALNAAYRARFGFPCIIAVRLHQTRDSLLASFRQRLTGSRETEVATALEQIGVIARGRLANLLGQSQGRLTTHVLDTAAGRPAAGVAYTLAMRRTGVWLPLAEGRTNAQGRTDAPLLVDIDMARGAYRLEFAVGSYFRQRGVAVADPPFLDLVPLEFGIAEPGAHYHVPLTCTPWGYSTYRGS